MTSPNSQAARGRDGLTARWDSAPQPGDPAYSLCRGEGCWSLVFAGRPAVLRHEKGLEHIAWLLAHPDESFHGLDLALRAGGADETDLEGVRSLLPVRDRAQKVLLLRRRQELRALLDSRMECEAVKEEARAELEALCNVYGNQLPDQAGRAVRAVRRAIGRCRERLASATDNRGAPHPVLRPFAEHLAAHLLRPSNRYAGPGRGCAAARRGLAGRFVYEPPPGVRWRCL